MKLYIEREELYSKINVMLNTAMLTNAIVHTDGNTHQTYPMSGTSTANQWILRQGVVHSCICTCAYHHKSYIVQYTYKTNYIYYISSLLGEEMVQTFPLHGSINWSWSGLVQPPHACTGTHHKYMPYLLQKIHFNCHQGRKLGSCVF